MKRIILAFFLFFFIGNSLKLKAQCDLVINNLVIQVVSNTPYPNPVTGPNCKAVFNASFDITTNSGFKYLFFHSWLSTDYPSPAVFNCGGSTPAVDPGSALQLGTVVDQAGKSFLDLGFVGLKDFLAVNPATTPTDITSLIATTYLHDNTVVLTQPANSPGLNAKVTKTGNILHFDITNLTVIINQSCGSTIAVKTDIWGSNSNAGDPKAQCYICALNQYFNDPTITGFKNCASPARQYAMGISTVDPVAKNITYKVYIDMNDNGSLEVGTDILAYTSGTISISASSPYSTGAPISLPAPYSNTRPYSEKGYLILVEGPSLSNSVLKYFPHPNGCITLPVDFGVFTASRISSDVVLKWETLTEVNNSGFAIERNTLGRWEQVAYVPTKAPGGNSQEKLVYTYTDRNDSRGISQYRIRQQDIDNQSRYSEIRSVRGEGQGGKVVLMPNPSSDGKVTVLFEDASLARELVLTDMSGRLIRQVRNITSNQVILENLQSGMYTLRIIVPATGIQSVHKLVVNKK